MAGAKIIAETDGQYIILSEKRGVFPELITDYITLKYKHFEGNRIFYKWNNVDWLEETMGDDGIHDGIFNCYMDGKVTQVMDAALVAKIVLEEDYDKFTNMFIEWHSIQIQQEFIKGMIGQFAHRITKNSERFIIDKNFSVTLKGIAYYKTDSKWRHLCLVSADSMQTRTINAPNGKIIVNTATQTALAKNHVSTTAESRRRDVYVAITRKLAAASN